MKRTESRRAAAKIADRTSGRNHRGGDDDAATPRLANFALPTILLALAMLQTTATLIPGESVWQGGAIELTLGWLVVATAAMIWAGGHGSPLRWRSPDFALLMLLIWTLLSAQWMAWQGNPRATWNTAWLWVALLAGYWGMRNVLFSPRTARALIAAVVAVSVALSAHGVYQFAIGMPAQKRHYAASNETEKQRLLRDNGIDPAPDSPQRRQFESRLGSTEPYATFGLANSLAGLLVPWTLLLAAVGTHPGANSGLSGRRRILWAFAMLLLLLCLLLTKSRSAWLAMLLGGSLLAAELARHDWGRTRIWIGAGGLAILLAITVGVISGSLDKEVLTEADLSLRYRMEYWQGAAAMLGEHPWFGCGPGNFQDYYTRYKPPQASESIADPHNLFAEVAATTGLVGGLALVLFFGLTFFQLCRWKHSPFPALPKEEGNSPRDSAGVYAGTLLGVLASVPLGLMIGFPPELLLGTWLPVTWIFGLPIVAGMLWMLQPWVRSGHLTPRLVAIPLFCLMVNLLAAGGVSFPGVGQSLWLLAAVGLNAIDASSGPKVAGAKVGEGARGRSSFIWLENRWSCRMGIVLLCGLTFAMYLQSYRPVTQARVLLQRAGESRNYQQLEGWYAQAATMDPLDPVPWQLLAELAQLRWLEIDQATYRERFERCLEEAERRNRQSAGFADFSGRLHLRAYRSAGHHDALKRALVQFRRAIELYPNHNMGHAQLAWVAHLAGNSTEARTYAEIALELDALNPHWELQLAQRSLQDPGPGIDVGEQPLSPPAGQSAEQLMRQLRSEKSEMRSPSAAP